MARGIRAVLCIAGICLAGLAPAPAVAQGFYLGESDKAYDFRQLLGRWHRSDNKAVLQITDIIVRNGKTTLLYFGGSVSGTVANAVIARSGNVLALTIPLDSVGAYGHRYELRYDPMTGTLRGMFFQPPLPPAEVVFRR